jgi:hypothetical protein
LYAAMPPPTISRIWGGFMGASGKCCARAGQR